MINHEILGGLKSAIERGETLQEAMVTLYNAGYKKEEIEMAAEVMQYGGSLSKTPNVSIKKIEPSIKTKNKLKKHKKIVSIPKRISSYGKAQNSKKFSLDLISKKFGKKLLIILLILGMAFAGLLIAFLLTT